MKRSRLRRVSAKRQQINLKLVELRLHVLERDQYRCQWCRTKGVVLDMHHIEKRSQRPDLVLEPTNVVTLCRTCHNWTDADPMGKQGRLKIDRNGGIVRMWIDYEGKLARLAGALFFQR